MKKSGIILFVAMGLPIFVMLCGWTWPNDVTFLGMKKYAQELKKNVFALQTEGNLANKDEKDDYVVLGSGFLIQKSNLIIGITCKHLILKYVELENGKIKTQKGKLVLKQPLYMGLDTADGYRKFKVEVLHIDGIYDFAMLIPVKDNPADNIRLTNLVLQYSYLGAQDLIKEGKGILVIGYPLSLGVEYNKNSPVVNFGIIAQYKEQDTFLIDATINHGNSGAPVFSLEDEKIIGMVTSFHNTQVPLYDENGKLVATLPYNSGLANALPAEAIKAKLDELIKS